MCGFHFIVLAHLLRFSCGPAETADGTCSLHGYRYQVGEVLLHTAVRGAMVQYRDMAARSWWFSIRSQQLNENFTVKLRECSSYFAKFTTHLERL